jgi:large subunit ribosomal protein L6
MSRKGKVPVPVPNGVEVKIDARSIRVKGPKGELVAELPHGIAVEQVEAELICKPTSDDPELSKFYGLARALVSNLVVGVSSGFEKRLEMIGVGYRAAVKGNAIDLQLGFSHPTLVTIPEGLEVKVEDNTKVVITGADRQRVGQFAADIRSLRPPEPYKGKGIRYAGEYVRRKAGKAAK